MPISIDELETNRFGIRAARVVDPDAGPAAIDAKALALAVNMITLRLNVSDLSRVHAFEAAGYRLMDTLVYYDRLLKELPHHSPTADGITYRLAVPEDVAAVSSVARAGFKSYMGHYHADPRLDKAAADEAYVEWAATSTQKASEDAPVLLALIDRQVAGFLTLQRNSTSDLEIVLNAVHPSFRRRSVYTNLLAKALCLAQGLGGIRIVTSTQINNYAVQRVWSRMGFAHCNSRYTFHKWF